MISGKKIYNGVNQRGNGYGYLDRLELFLAIITAFLAPINAARLPGVFVTFADITAILCLFVILVNRGFPNRIFGPLTEIYFFGILVFCGSLLLSSMINGNAIDGFIGVSQYILAYLIFPFVLLRQTYKEAWLIAFAFLASIAIICIHGIIIITLDMDVSIRFVSYSGRLRGLVERVNEFGALLAMTVPLVIVLTRVDWFPRYLAWIGLLCMLYTVMLTGSNTGIFCFVFAFFATMVTGKNVMRDFAIVCVIMIALGLMIAIFGTEILPDVFEKRVLSAFNSGDIEELGTFSDRMDLNVEALYLAAEHLFVGVGFDQYKEVTTHGHPVHNLYLLLINEGGVFALFGFLVMIIALFVHASHAMLYTRSLSAGAYLAITITIFALIVSALPHVYGRFLVMPWIVALGLTMTAYSKHRNQIVHDLSGSKKFRDVKLARE